MKRTPAFLVIVLGFSAIAFALKKPQCGQFPAPGFDGPEMSSFVGEYSNPNYLFAVTIPAGLVGHDTPPPNPQHGFGVILFWEPRRYFWFDSRANSDLWEDEKQALADHLKWLRSNAQKVVSTQERRATLGSQPARQQIIHYFCPDSQLERVQVIIVSLGRGLADEAGLLTTSDRFASDYQVFISAVTTWHTTGKY